MVMILSSIDLISDSAAYSVVVLPLPVGPGHQHHAVRLGDVLAEPAQLVLGEAQDVEPQLVELLADRFLVEDTDDRVLAVHARHDRDAEVDRLARHAQLEAAVLRHALLGDVELRHDLHARDDRAVEPLVDRPHRRLQHAVDPVLHVHRIVLRLDVDVARAPLDRAVERRVHEPDDRARVGGQLLDRQRLVAPSSSRRIWSWKLSVASSSTRCELSLFFRIDWIADGVPTVTLIGVASSTPSSSIIGRSVGSETTMTSDVAFAAIRHEAVAQHQVGGNRAEQLVVDAELRQIDELEPIPLGQPPGLRDFCRMLGVGRLDAGDVELGVGRRVWWLVSNLSLPVASCQLRSSCRHVPNLQA